MSDKPINEVAHELLEAIRKDRGNPRAWQAPKQAEKGLERIVARLESKQRVSRPRVDDSDPAEKRRERSRRAALIRHNARKARAVAEEEK